ncbi:hypothetical protein BJY01DRAFT_178898 [Aspergillus pseudoustus]|uniref:Secreted protein n=1 Tax=Aspergillus pseudoustus TaxID=1810923 RepID=A0ABR4KVU2_9EURO
MTPLLIFASLLRLISLQTMAFIDVSLSNLVSHSSRAETEGQEKNNDRQHPFLGKCRRSRQSHWAPLDMINQHVLTLYGTMDPTHVVNSHALLWSQGGSGHCWRAVVIGSRLSIETEGSPL